MKPNTQKSLERFDLAVALFLSFHEVVAQEDVKHQCKKPEDCFINMMDNLKQELEKAIDEAERRGAAKKGEHGRKMYQRGYEERRADKKKGKG